MCQTRELKKGCRSANGQAMVEYLIVTAVLLAAVTILAVFLYVFKAEGGRVLDLVSFDYP